MNSSGALMRVNQGLKKSLQAARYYRRECATVAEAFLTDENCGAVGAVWCVNVAGT
uniref:Uncharacterized protein n=1 Tax=Anguilla anguilla TaxID=7936 RepID=A0A0E9Q9F5_ANGAN